jgi:hypothetical protein
MDISKLGTAQVLINLFARCLGARPYQAESSIRRVVLLSRSCRILSRAQSKLLVATQRVPNCEICFSTAITHNFEALLKCYKLVYFSH